MATFADAVRALPDDAIVALLRARPDLASPSPSTLRSLAARATSRTSLDRALARLDTPTLQVLEAVLALTASAPEVRPDDVAAAVGATDPDDAAAVVGLLRRAREQALLWEPAPGAVRAAPGLDELFGPGAGMAAAQAGAASAGVAAAPVATAGAGMAPTSATPAGAGLAPAPNAAGAGTVAAVAVPHGTLRLALTPPVPADARPVRADVADAEAASAAVEVVRLVDTLIRTWQDAPPPVLRAGGLGVRDLRRTAQALDVDEATAASVVELAATAGLIDDDGDDPPSYVPTTRADHWDEAGTAERWGMLAAAWAGSRRMPWLAGTRDDKGAVRAPLSPDLGRGWVPRLRTLVLAALAALGPIEARPADVVADLAWRTPRAVPPEAAVVGLLREAALLGVTGAGSLAAPGRSLLALLRGEVSTDPRTLRNVTPSAGLRDIPQRSTAAGEDGRDAEGVLADALGATLPEPVDELLLQGDLTGIVPGRPSAELASLIERATDVESRGAATTVRFTPASVTRALDAGATADELLEQLSRLSRTPVPQALDYLVRDTARRHAALRVGAATSYVRAADPAVLTGLVEDPRLADLGLIRLAPTVVAASVPAAALQAALRGRGLLAALEGPDGRPLGRLRRPARIERGGARALRSPYAVSGGPTSDAERRELVERLRIADGEGRRSPFASTAGGEAGISIATARGARTPTRASAPAAATSSEMMSASPGTASTSPTSASPGTASTTPATTSASPGAASTTSGTATRGTTSGTSADDASGAPQRAASGTSRVPGWDAGSASATAATSSTTGTGGTAARPSSGTPAPGDALALLRDAVREGGHVWLELVDGQGRPMRRRVRPLRVDGGRLRALDPQRGSELTVAIHRIAAVDPDDD